MEKPSEVSFFKKPCVFTILSNFFLKKEQQRNHYWKDSSRNDGFYNTFAACTGTMKTLLPVDENRHFFAITMGRMKPETRADEGSERCCCCCCCRCGIVVVVLMVIFIV